VYVPSLPTVDSSLQNLDRRLQKRYGSLVAAHCGQATTGAAGPRILPAVSTTLAATQAAWRFYHNDAIHPKLLGEPLRNAAEHLVPALCQEFVLAVHDWSDLDFRAHASKKDCMVLGQKEEIGYELQTCLLLDDGSGSPLAPIHQAVKSANGLTSSRYVHTTPWPEHRTNLDDLVGTMNYVRRLSLGRPAVHIIDAEADSVYHMRAWSKAGHLFLVRADPIRLVKHQGQKKLLSVLHTQLREQQAFQFCRTILYHGRKAEQFVAETDVVLYRPARLKRKADGGKRRDVKGKPLPLRLVVSEVRHADGEVLAVWLLLTNVPARIEAAEVALWYYWRWRIESYFKLLKTAGQQLEHWQQETAEALTKRLLVASMACTLVWQVSRAPGAEGEELRELLVRLSGRVLRRGQAWTLPALLAGTWVLLAMLEVLERYTPEQLRKLGAGLTLGAWTGSAPEAENRIKSRGAPP
jgi:hypothetical protein